MDHPIIIIVVSRQRGFVQARILIASTTWWAMPARIASAFVRAGASVSGVVPRGSPLATVNLLSGVFHYSALRPLRSLSKAILDTQPDLIVPCDDRVVEHLHELHAYSVAARDGAMCKLIERSLGDSQSYSITNKRGALLELAQSLGIRIPDTISVRSLASLHTFIARYGFPIVLKIDGTWGGTGVRVVRSSEEAVRTFTEFTRPLSWFKMLEHICHHDFFPLFSKADQRRHSLTAQVFVEGTAANIMLACWEGEVLDTLSVETLFAIDKLGSSTIVKTIRDQEIEHAGRLLVQSLAISGFCGLDFIIESSSGKAFLIELNPRATQNGHLEPGGQASLVNTLYRHLLGEPPQKKRFSEETIAFFPHILRCDARTIIPNSSTMIRDVPWDEPALIRELMRKPWNRRHISSLLYAGARQLIERGRSLIRK